MATTPVSNTFTGSTLLPDIGTLAYNGVVFSSLYQSKISCEDLPDNANRTVKLVRCVLVADGIVTLNAAMGDQTTDRALLGLQKLLSQQAGVLTYSGKGFGNPLVINQPGGRLFDVAWGPIPKVLDFIPLGASRSASVVWRCVFHIPAAGMQNFNNQIITNSLQFNNETSISYDEDGYSSVTIRGTLEIALTRPTQGTKTLVFTVDDARDRMLRRISDDFDLTRFKVNTRTFDISRDKRTLEFEFHLEQLPPMGLPTGIMSARGTYTFKPAKEQRNVRATINWIASLRITYKLSTGEPRRVAWLAFMAFWHWRMRQSSLAVANSNELAQAYQNLQNAQAFIANMGVPNWLIGATAINPIPGWLGMNNVAAQALQNLNNAIAEADRILALGRAWPIHFAFSEGLHLDSKVITFEAAWTLISSLQTILASSGLWTQPPGVGGNRWATSVKPISGPYSWYFDKLDATKQGQAIVDFGG